MSWFFFGWGRGGGRLIRENFYDFGLVSTRVPNSALNYSQSVVRPQETLRSHYIVRRFSPFQIPFPIFRYFDFISSAWFKSPSSFIPCDERRSFAGNKSGYVHYAFKGRFSENLYGNRSRLLREDRKTSAILDCFVIGGL